MRIVRQKESVGGFTGTLFTQRKIIKGRVLTAGERGINISEMIARIGRTGSRA